MEPIDKSRRQLSLSLLSLAGLPITTSLPAVTAAATASKKFSLAGVHREAAATAAALNANKSTQLSILFPKGSAANIKPATREFTRLTGIEFSFIEAPVDDINTRMFLEAQLSTGSYDIALPATFGIPDLVEAGAIAALDQFSSRYQPQDFNANVLYTIGDYYRGRHYGYQTDGDTYLMFYNKRFLNAPEQREAFADKHGYELKIPDTWQELDTMMAHFHDPDRGAYGGALFRIPTYMLWEWWIRFHAKGYFPLDDELNPQINNSAGIEALEELIAASRYLTPNANSNGLFDNWKEFANGNIFCNIGWGGTQKYLHSEKSAIRGDLEFGPTPGGIVDGQLIKTSYFNWGWNYTIAKNSAHPEIAYLFALFACSPVISTIAVQERNGYFDPFRKEHYQDPTIIDTYSKAFMEEHRKSLVNSIPDLYLKGQTQYYDALRTHITMAHDGKLSARAALDETAKIWRRLHFKLGKKNQAEQWQFLKNRYPLQLRNRLH